MEEAAEESMQARLALSEFTAMEYAELDISKFSNTFQTG